MRLLGRLLAISVLAVTTQAAGTYGNLPLSFEANQGPAQFLARGRGYALSLNSGEAILQLRNQPASVRMKLVGANPQPSATGLEELSGKSNYLIGNDPAKWRTNIPNYSKVMYRDVYPGINLVYYGNQRNLEYDLVVAPSADPEMIHLAFEGARALRLNAQGDLVLDLGNGEIELRKPVIYQEKGGRRITVRGGYVLEGGQQVGFQLAKYDRRRPLFIDPVLSYSTYLGGSGDDLANGIAVDSNGSAYIVGSTTSTNFPTASAAQSASGGGQDVFVTKLNPAGTGVTYSTYLGGSGNDYGYGITVDTSGNAYLTGQTTSTNFPTSSAFQSTNGGGADAFVVKLNPTGSGLVYSTYLGGSGSEEGRSIVIDSAGNAYVTGQTSSPNFPTAGALQPAFGGGASDVFLAKFNAAGSGLVYSTYMGGNGTDVAYGIAVDSSGSAIITGLTDSPNFPTAVPLQSVLGGGVDAFVSKVNTAGSAYVYSTYLGGSAADQGLGIAVDSSGNAYVTGWTASTNFPTASPFQASTGGGEDAFTSKLSPSGTLVYSTYLGGTGNDRGFGIALDPQGNAHITGYTQSANFPLVSSVQATNGGGQDVFITRLNATGSALTYSTYLGGAGADGGLAITVDATGSALVAGFASAGFPTTAGAFRTAMGGGNFDGFVAKIAIPQGACTVTWTGGTGSWQTPANWSGNALPGPTDNVCIDASSTVTLSSGTQSINSLTNNGTLTISGGSLSIAAASTVNSNFTLSGGTLTGAGVVTFTGLFTWTGGTMAGTGVTSIAAGATLAISGSVEKDLSARTVNNAGTVTWTGTGSIGSGQGAVFNNSALFDTQNDASFFYNCGSICGAATSFNNTGTFRKSAGAGTTTFGGSIVFNNSGTVDVQTGTLTLAGGGAGSGGFNGAAAATLTLAGGTHNLGGNISGPAVNFTSGTVNFTGAETTAGPFTISGATVNFNSASASTVTTVALSGGTLGGTGVLNVSGSLTWTGGFMSGIGTTAITAGATLTISGSAEKDISGRTLNNAGNAIWSGTGAIGSGQGALFSNSGFFDLQNDASFFFNCGSICGAVATITNTGTFRKSAAGSGTTSIGNVVFNNNGTVDVQSGTLSLAGGGTGSGGFTGTALSTLTFAGGTHNLSGNISGPAVVFSAGTVNLGVVTSAGPFTISGGTANFTGAADSTVTTVALSAGTLGGAGGLTVSGNLTWTGGLMAGTGTTTIPLGATLAISGTAEKDLSARMLTSAGTTTWTGTGAIGSGQGALFSNSGLFDAQSDASFFFNCGFICGTVATFTNTGTFRKSAGTATTSIGNVVFNNNGTVDVQTGTLSLAGGGTGSGGFTGAAAATLTFAGGTHSLSGNIAGPAVIFSAGTVNFSSAVTSAGPFTISGGAVNFNGAAASTVTTVAFSGGTLGGTGVLTVSGSLAWSGGIMAGAGSTNIPAGASLAISGSAEKDLSGRTVSNSGTVTWAGTGAIGSGQGALFSNAGVFDAQNDASFFFNCGFICGTVLIFNNSGTFRKTTTTGTTTFNNVVFNNTGTVDVQSGTLSLGSGGTGNGSFTGIAGTTLNFSGGTHTLSGGISAPTVIFSAGTVNHSGSYSATVATTVNGGTVTFTGTVASIGALSISGGAANISTAAAGSVATLALSGGTLGGTGVLTVTGTLTWTGGIMTGPGTTSIPAGATVAISGSAEKDLIGRIVTSAGAVTWTGTGAIGSGQGAVFTNSGTFEAQNDVSFFFNCGFICGTAMTFNNSGTFRKTNTTGTTTFNAVVFNNTGTVDLQSGTLSLGNGGTGNGSFAGIAGTTVNFSGGTHTLSGGISAPTVIFSSGVVNHSGSYSATVATTVNGGTVTFTGTVASIGALSISGGTANISTAAAGSVATLALSGGTLGGTGVLSVTGSLTWTGGIMAGPGTTDIPAGATVAISGSAEKDLIGRIVTSAGAVTWAGTGAIGSGQGAVFTNSGTFEAQNDMSFFFNCGFICGTAMTFNNQGTFRKTTTTGTTTFNTVVFNNTGTVDVQSGTLSLGSGGTGNGSFGGAAGTTLNFSGGTHTLSGGINAPTVIFSAGTVNHSASYSATVATTVSGGTVTFTGTVASIGALSISGGAANISTAAAGSVATLALSGGTLGGTGVLSVTGTLTWTGGIMAGPGTTNIPAGATVAISGSAEKDLSGRIVNNSGAVTLTGTGAIGSGGGAVFTNSGTFEAQNDSSFFFNCGFICGTAMTFNNQGTFRKTTTTGTTTFTNVVFNNTGTVRVLSGTVNFATGYTQTSGATTLEGGNLAGTTLNIQGGNLSGTGNITANVTNASQVNPGLSPGVLNIIGNYTQSAAGVLNIEIGGLAVGSQFDRLNVSGLATLGGTVNFILINSFSPTVGNTFLILSYGSRSGSFANANTPNAGAGLTLFPAYNPGDLTLAAGVPTADVSVTQTDSPDTVLPGTNVTYTMTVSNAGPSVATGVTLSDTIPSGTIFISATPSQGSCSGTTSISCNLGTIGIGGSATFTLVVQPSGLGMISNTAIVSANELDSNPSNNSATEGTTVTASPGPLITSLAPTTATVAGAGFLLTVNGSGFVTGATVSWNGVARAANFISISKLTVPILAGDIAASGTALISMTNPAGTASNTVSFIISGSPAPSLGSLSPASTTAGGAGFTLIVNGSGFVTGAVVRWNGADRVTTLANSTQVRAAITPGDIASSGTAQVTVFNPAPGGGLSNALTFTMNPTGGTVAAGQASGAIAGTASIPITLTLGSGVSVDSLSFGVQVTTNGASPPLSGTLSFTPNPALTAPTFVDVSGGPSMIGVSWASFASPLSGTANLGSVVATIPATATAGQTYTVQITGASASLASANVGLLPGSNATLTAGSTYLVGDGFPGTPTTAFNLGQFGDDSLNNLDLVAALRAVTLLPGSVPPVCSDLYDAMDSFPVDGVTRGGDGALNNFDLIETLRRVVSLDTTRPRRGTRGLVCPSASPLMKKRPGVQPDAAGALEFGVPQATASGALRVPVYLRADRDLPLAALSLGLGFRDSTLTLQFIAVGERTPTLVDNGLPGMLAVAWLDGFTVSAGESVLLGYVEMEGSEELARSLQVFGVVANSQDGGDIVIAFPLSSR